MVTHEISIVNVLILSLIEVDFYSVMFVKNRLQIEIAEPSRTSVNTVHTLFVDPITGLPIKYETNDDRITNGKHQSVSAVETYQKLAAVPQDLFTFPADLHL